MKSWIGILILFSFMCCREAIGQTPRSRPKNNSLTETIRPKVPKKILRQLKLMEDSLKVVAWRIINDSLAEDKKKAAFAFVPAFKRALKLDYSFFYPFDSLATISILYPPDSTFRIFTWQVYYGRGVTRYFGVIQMRSVQMKIFPLFDRSDSLPANCQAVLGPETWWGQLYYNLIQKTVKGKNIYTLFGFEAVDILQRRKLIDFLTFDEEGKPHFGAPLLHYSFSDTALRTKAKDTLHRMFMSYKWNAPTVLNFDPEIDMIVFDHLSAPSPEAKDASFMFVPDGTYEGFVWKSDRWNWVETVFTFAINENDNPPIPMPLFGKPEKQPNLNPDKEPE